MGKYARLKYAVKRHLTGEKWEEEAEAKKPQNSEE